MFVLFLHDHVPSIWAAESMLVTLRPMGFMFTPNFQKELPRVFITSSCAQLFELFLLVISSQNTQKATEMCALSL